MFDDFGACCKKIRIPTDCLQVKSPTQYLGVSDSHNTVSIERCILYGTHKLVLVEFSQDGLAGIDSCFKPE